ncbi:MAG: thioredoxin family protein [Deltaproteobacteria bacterium]|nr:thioredoxin family protein [Deltaproteobacteria bacterium]
MHQPTLSFGLERQTNKSRLNIGDKAPYFSLKGTDGKIYSLDNLADERALVIVFWSNHCPMCRSYENKLLAIAEKYQGEGVKFLAISSNDAEYYPEDSFEKMMEKSKKHNFIIPYVKDETQVVAKVFDVACTPEVYLFDGQRRLRYHGCIDQEYHKTEASSGIHEHGLVDALDSILAGKEIAHPHTPCFGCTIKWRVSKANEEQGWSY